MRGIEGLTLGRYELGQRIAQGGMAEVYLGFDRRVKRQVAEPSSRLWKVPVFPDSVHWGLLPTL